MLFVGIFQWLVKVNNCGRIWK